MRKKGITPGISLACAALLLLQVGGCVVAYGENGSSTPNTYTKGQWIQKQAEADNRERALARRVADALENDPLLSQTNIKIRVTGHVVTLTGTLYDLSTYRHAITVVEQTEGVKTVTSRIELNLTD